jgi:hypothetical protein
MSAFGYFILFVAFIIFALVAVGAAFLWAMSWLAGSVVVDGGNETGPQEIGMLLRNWAFPMIWDASPGALLPETILRSVWEKLGIYFVNVGKEHGPGAVFVRYFYINENCIVGRGADHNLYLASFGKETDKPVPDVIPLRLDLNILTMLESGPVQYLQYYSIENNILSVATTEIWASLTDAAKAVARVHDMGVHIPGAIILHDGEKFRIALGTDILTHNSAGVEKRKLIVQERLDEKEFVDIGVLIPFIRCTDYSSKKLDLITEDAWNKIVGVIEEHESPALAASLKFTRMFKLVALALGFTKGIGGDYFPFCFTDLGNKINGAILDASWQQLATGGNVRALVAGILDESVRWCADQSGSVVKMGTIDLATEASSVLEIIRRHFAKSQVPFVKEDVALELESYSVSLPLAPPVPPSTSVPQASGPPPKPVEEPIQIPVVRHQSQSVGAPASKTADHPRSTESSEEEIILEDIMKIPHIPSSESDEEITDAEEPPLVLLDGDSEESGDVNMGTKDTLPISSETPPTFVAPPEVPPQEAVLLKKIEVVSLEAPPRFTDADFDHVRQGHRIRSPLQI